MPYNTVNRRVRALEEHGYIKKKAVKEKTKTGFAAKLYQLTARAYVAMLLKMIDLGNFLNEASESSILSALGTFSFTGRIFSDVKSLQFRLALFMTQIWLLRILGILAWNGLICFSELR